MKPFALAALIGIGVFAQCVGARAAGTERAYFAGGCFWCVESDFEKVRGVSEVISGYTGGTVSNPTYKQVTRGGTGHFEAVEIQYDPARVSYSDLLYAFFRSVDPTDAGGQFCDRGDSYRTAVFVSTPAEREAAELAKSRAQSELGRQIVTPILDAAAFYPAEAYHQDYYKATDVVLTRRGPKSKADAYKFYRSACGRDERVKELWGGSAVFLN
jgi:peptide-methionine (S)-S-oxide reductase